MQSFAFFKPPNQFGSFQQVQKKEPKKIKKFYVKKDAKKRCEKRFTKGKEIKGSVLALKKCPEIILFRENLPISDSKGSKNPLSSSSA